MSVSIKSVAMPAQHGGWGFLIEPLLIGLIAAPSWGGVGLVIAAFGVFLMHQPLKITFKDWRKRRRYARTRLAERFVMLYGVMALGGFVIALAAADSAFVIPLVLAVPFALVQLAYEGRNEARESLPEISGALAFASTAAAIPLMSGAQLLIPAFALWIAAAARVIPSILYVRTRLRLEADRPFDPAPPLIAHAAALILVLMLIAAQLLTPLALIGSLVLLIRAAFGMLRPRRPTPAKVIGFREIAYGLLYAVLTGLSTV